ncbi:MAG: hypothetical protein HZY73_09885 [Micropruina sp.]|nr:MAG: hypothetical protein HZY73_09885 [Micropruina sp.]
MGAVIGLGVGFHLDVGFWEGTWGPKEILSESLDFVCRTLTPPSFEMLSPPEGAEVSSGGLGLTLRAKAWDEHGPLPITWKINGEVLKVVASNEPILWAPAKPGDYTIEARAGNGAGKASPSGTSGSWPRCWRSRSVGSPTARGRSWLPTNFPSDGGLRSRPASGPASWANRRDVRRSRGAVPVATWTARAASAASARPIPAR